MKHLPKKALVVGVDDDPEFYQFAELQSAMVVRKNGIALQEMPSRRDALAGALVLGAAAVLVLGMMGILIFGR